MKNMVVAGTQNAGFQPGSGQQTSGHTALQTGRYLRERPGMRKDIRLKASFKAKKFGF